MAWFESKEGFYENIECCTSYARAKTPIHKYIKFAETSSNKVMSYVTQLGRFNDKSVQKNDLLLMYIRLDRGEFAGEEVVEPAEQAIVNLGTEVDLHYRYTAMIEEEHYSDNEGCDEC